jgi:multiple sugar transport system substrate-binding protein
MTHKLFYPVTVILLAFVLVLSACGAPADGSADKPVTVEFWTFPDWGTGEAGALFQTFVTEFEAENPDIKIKFVPKADLEQAIIAGAGSGVYPDAFTVAFNQGDTFLKTGIVEDVAPYYNAMPAEFKSQFNPGWMQALSPGGHVWGLPFTAYAQVLYRNTTVLEKSGIDPNAGIKDWADWLAQMEKIQAAGYTPIGDLTVDGWFVMGFVGAAGGKNGVADGKTTVSADALTQALTFFKDVQPYSSEIGNGDQANVDLFTNNEVAYYIMGPWANPGLLDAKNANPDFNYDYMLVPGATATQFGGTNGGEWIGVTKGPRSEAAFKWAAFLADSAQTQRFAAQLGRTVLNDVAMTDPEVQKNDLNVLTAKATNYGFADAAYFTFWPLDARTPFKDAAEAVWGGQDPASAAQAAIESLNLILADAPAVPTAPPAADPVTVEFWTFPDWGTGDAGALFQTFVAEFEAENPDIKIKFVPKADLEQSIVAGAGSGVYPDAFTVAFNQGDTFLRTGIVEDVAPYYNAMPAEFKSQFNPGWMQALSPDSHVWGLPFTAYAQLLYRNTTILENAGVDTAACPKDWSDWLSQMEKIQVAGYTPIGDLTVDGWFVMGFVGAAGGKNGVADGKTTVSADALTQALTFFKDVQPYSSEIGNGDQANVDLFTTNEVAFYIMGPWANPGLLDSKNANPDFNYDYCLVPGATATQFGGTNGGEWIGVTKGPHSEAAFKWAAFLADSAQTQRFAAQLGRTVLNDVAMADPEVQKNDLNVLTARATNYGFADAAYFTFWPLDARTPFKDAASDVWYGTSPADAAQAAIEALNDILASAP